MIRPERKKQTQSKIALPSEKQDLCCYKPIKLRMQFHFMLSMLRNNCQRNSGNQSQTFSQ